MSEGIQIPDANLVLFHAVEKLKVSWAHGDAKLLARLDLCLRSLSKYPLPLASPHHCRILEGFSKEIIGMIVAEVDQVSPSTSSSSSVLTNLCISPIKNAFQVIGSNGKRIEPVMIELSDDDDSTPTLSEERQKSQEEEDLKVALRLSWEMGQEAEVTLQRQLTQEEEDRQLALKLHEENYETYLGSPPPKASKLSDAFSLDEERLLKLLLEAPSPGIRSNVGDISSIIITPPQPKLEAEKAKQHSGLKSSAVATLFSQDPVFARMSAQNLSTEKKVKKTQVAKTKAYCNPHAMSDSGDSDLDSANPKPSSSGLSRQASQLNVVPVHSLSDSDEEITKTKSRSKAIRGNKKSPVKKRKGRNAADNFVLTEEELPQWFHEARQIKSEELQLPVDQHNPEFMLQSGDFEVLLLVDTQEVAGGNQGGKRSKKEITVKELKANGVPFETRHLNVGDFAWIAREKVAFNPSSLRQRQPKELVLPYVVERKRLDDLKSSIVDGRYREQKFRLRQCGLKNVIYLIEGFSKHKKYWTKDAGGQPFKDQAICSAVASTSLMERFSVEVTEDQRDSMTYLTHVTRALRDKYHPLSLSSCTREDMESSLVECPETTLLTFQEFNDKSKKQKPLTTQDLFSRMLMLQHGVTASMSAAIAVRYPNLGMLMEAYDHCSSEEERESLLAGMSYEATKRIRPAVSKVMAWLYNDEEIK